MTSPEVKNADNSPLGSNTTAQAKEPVHAQDWKGGSGPGTANEDEDSKFDGKQKGVVTSSQVVRQE